MTVRRRIPLSLLALALGSVPAAAQHTEPEGRVFRGFLFGDMTVVATEQDVRDGFVIGQLVGHGNAGLSERLNVFIELSATARSTQYSFEVERAILRYDFADPLKLSAGRYHTPIAYWNTAMHHGLWLQTSVARPELARIGGVFIPVHFVGAMAEGVLAAPPLTFAYEAGVGNGRDSSIGRGGDAGDVNASRASVLAARVRPAVPFGLQLGGSVYFDRITTVDAAADERIATAHVVWDRGAPELIAEYASVRHDPGGGLAATTSEAYYLHGALRLPRPLSALKPYGRVEQLDVADDDVVFTSLIRDYEATVLGVRWDFETLATAKFEVRRERIAGGARFHSAYVQLAFVVPSFAGM